MPVLQSRGWSALQEHRGPQNERFHHQRHREKHGATTVEISSNPLRSDGVGRCEPVVTEVGRPFQMVNIDHPRWPTPYIVVLTPALPPVRN
jgi:hypothetical protein